LKITAIKPYAIATPVTDWTFVKVETDDPQFFGWGECSLPGKPHGVLGALRDLQKLVLGHDPLNSEFLWQRMYRHGYWRGGPIQTSAMSGIDVALWDIRGKAWRQPLHKLLGGAVRTKVKLYANIGLSCDADEFRRRGEIALAMGYRGVKIYPLPAVGPVEGPAVLRQIAGCCGAIRDLLDEHARSHQTPRAERSEAADSSHDAQRRDANSTSGRNFDFAVDMHGRCTTSLATQIEATIRQKQRNGQAA